MFYISCDICSEAVFKTVNNIIKGILNLLMSKSLSVCRGSFFLDLQLVSLFSNTLYCSDQCLFPYLSVIRIHSESNLCFLLELFKSRINPNASCSGSVWLLRSKIKCPFSSSSETVESKGLVKSVHLRVALTFHDRHSQARDQRHCMLDKNSMTMSGIRCG